MDTKEWWLFSFVTSSGYYKKDQMTKDIEKIKNLYFDNGYIKVMAAEPEITLDKQKKGMTINIRISEGDLYKLTSMNFAGNKAFDNETIQKKIKLVPNTVFRKSLLEKDMRSISDLYSENGYALVSVMPDLSPDDSNKTVAVTLHIEEGDKYRIGRIEISGNTKTRDKVIRREIRLAEGDTFDSSKLRRSYERINNLQFFEIVDMVPKPKYEEKVVDLDVKVKEKPTGFLSVGGGYSSADGIIGTVDITKGKIIGKEHNLKEKTKKGEKRT